jgi:biopolymer transport protein ExbB/biopolymer transport protein TolQ
MLIERLERVALLGSSWVLYLLLLLSFLSIAVMVERFFYFRGRNEDIFELGDRVVRLLSKGDRRGAEELIIRSRAIEATVLRRAFPWIDGGPKAITEALEAEMGRTRKELEKGMTFLGTLGNNAPFVGLLGTVLGVIQAFHQLGDGQNKAAMGNVMSGIAEALIATGVGLVVALPAVVGYNVVQKKIADVEANVAAVGKRLIAYLEYCEHSPETEAPRALTSIRPSATTTPVSAVSAVSVEQDTDAA